MAADSRVVLAAPAKVNLYLGVGARRPDGYHDVQTVLQAVSLFDTVTIEMSDTLSFECTPDLGLPAEDNLAFRAAVELGKAAGHPPSLHISLEKRIPPGGGLGGASADAAAVLVGLAELWGLAGSLGPERTRELVSEVAASLGADVPFFISGGTALFGGRGDVLIRQLPTPHLDIVLVKVDEPVPTGAAYAAFDRMSRTSAPGSQSVEDACVSGDALKIAQALFNNMTEAAVSLVGSIGDVVAWCRGSSGVLGVALAGSGSTVFAVCESRSAAIRTAEAARARGWWAEPATTEPHGVAFKNRSGAAV